MSTVTFQGVTVTVINLQCSTVRPALTTAMNWQGWTASACSANPVIVGTNITFTNTAGVPYTQAITAVDTGSSNGGGSTTTTVNEPFDYQYASGIWALGFTSVLGLYLLALKVGTVLKLIRG
jgi:hypothetical protein